MSNSRILKNSAFLYIRLLITLALGLFTMRIVINALGIHDYGIYGVVAGLITMFGFMNVAMSSSTQRYLAFNLGLKDSIKLQQTFTTAVNIHLFIAVISFLLAEAVHCVKNGVVTLGCHLTTDNRVVTLGCHLTTDNKKTTKEIEDAIQYAEQHNWRIETGGGHA